MPIYFAGKERIKMARKYKRLRYDDRLAIERALAQGMSIEEVAKKLDVHRDTIYKELKRGNFTKTTYNAKVAQQLI